MKSSDEMVNSLLERREQYVAGQKRKRKMLARTVTSMCCVCLVALLGFGMRQSELFRNNDTKIEQTQEYQSIQQTEGDENLFVVNKADSIMDTDMDVQINSFNKIPYYVWVSILEDFHEFVGITYEEFTDKIPDNFECFHFYSLSIPGYKDADLKDEYHLHDYVFEYRTENGGEAIIAICSSAEPLRDYFIRCNNPKQSEINGVPVMIYGYQDTFVVQFAHEKINYDIETSNITLEELENLLIGIME